MTQNERERHRVMLLVRACPVGARAERDDPIPIALRFLVIDGELLVRAQMLDERDRAPLLWAVVPNS